MKYNIKYSIISKQRGTMLAIPQNHDDLKPLESSLLLKDIRLGEKCFICSNDNVISPLVKLSYYVASGMSGCKSIYNT